MLFEKTTGSSFVPRDILLQANTPYSKDKRHNLILTPHHHIAAEMRLNYTRFWHTILRKHFTLDTLSKYTGIAPEDLTLNYEPIRHILSTPHITDDHIKTWEVFFMGHLRPEKPDIQTNNIAPFNTLKLHVLYGAFSHFLLRYPEDGFIALKDAGMQKLAKQIKKTALKQVDTPIHYKKIDES